MIVTSIERKQNDDDIKKTKNTCCYSVIKLFLIKWV
jgi:hypothetical protein